MLDLEQIDDEMVEVDLDIDGTPKPPKNKLIALIDADTVAFTACLSTEVQGELLDKEFYSDKEWEEILADPGYCSETMCLFETDRDLALQKADEKLQRILDKTGCQEVELHFSGGRENFRYEIFPEYKANRIGTRAPMGLKQLKEDTKLTLNDITFETNSADLNESSYLELDRVVKLMIDNPDIKIEISAHTDDVGSSKYNLRLSDRRAKSVIIYMLDSDIDTNRLIAKGYGESTPIVPNDSDENKAKNRRVELKILEVEKS